MIAARESWDARDVFADASCSVRIRVKSAVADSAIAFATRSASARLSNASSAFCLATSASRLAASSVRNRSSNSALTRASTAASISYPACVRASSCACNSMVSDLKSTPSWLCGFSSTRIAFRPNSSVESVSKRSAGAPEVQQTKEVIAPPKHGESNRVSFDSRTGALLLDPRPFASAWMHRPRVVRDWLIEMASSNEWPTTPDRLVRSEPAKSTRKSLPLALAHATSEGRSEAGDKCVVSFSGPRIAIISTACERDESAFNLVNAVVRRASALATSAHAASALSIVFH
mmetsp:Transcript_6876/g.14124  ORF Transcript_6876/g.14124 Transcript_6876/m.14124 type:complete len:289 (+) Transcript_6876:679-1545(+)